MADREVMRERLAALTLDKIGPVKLDLTPDNKNLIMEILLKLDGDDTDEGVLEVRADEKQARKNAKLLKRMTAADRKDQEGMRRAAGHSKVDPRSDGVAEWRQAAMARAQKGKTPAIFAPLGSKLKPKVRLLLCDEKDVTKKDKPKLVLLPRKKDLAELLKVAKGKLNMKKMPDLVFVKETGARVTDTETVLDEVVLVVSVSAESSGKTAHKKKSSTPSTSAAPPAAPPAAASTPALTVASLRSFYEKYCPEKADRVAVMLEKFSMEVHAASAHCVSARCVRTLSVHSWCPNCVCSHCVVFSAHTVYRFSSSSSSFTRFHSHTKNTTHTYRLLCIHPTALRPSPGDPCAVPEEVRLLAGDGAASAG
jgi:hypothetical protein